MGTIKLALSGRQAICKKTYPLLLLWPRVFYYAFKRCTTCPLRALQYYPHLHLHWFRPALFPTPKSPTDLLKEIATSLHDEAQLAQHGTQKKTFLTQPHLPLQAYLPGIPISCIPAMTSFSASPRHSRCGSLCAFALLYPRNTLLVVLQNLLQRHPLYKTTPLQPPHQWWVIFCSVLPLYPIHIGLAKKFVQFPQNGSIALSCFYLHSKQFC